MNSKTVTDFCDLLSEFNSVALKIFFNTFVSISTVVAFSLIVDNRKYLKKDKDETLKKLYEPFIKDNKMKELKYICEKSINHQNASEILPILTLLLVKYEKYSFLKYLLNQYIKDKFIIELLIDYQNQNKISTNELKKRIPGNNFKINLNYKDEKGNTPLIMACEKGNLSMVEYLVKCGADLNEKNNKGQTAIMMASQQNHKSIVLYLVNNGAKINKSIKKILSS